MAKDTPNPRALVLALVVIGIVVVVLGAFLLIGLLEDDETNEIDPQNGQVVTLLP
jgi:multisubunit Na+/H+ antiporter MnhC subunit